MKARLNPAEQWQKLRALEALERIGTPEAIQVLQGLAAGGPSGQLTEEAHAALGRLRKSQ